MYRNSETGHSATCYNHHASGRCFSVELLISPSFFYNLCDDVPFHENLLCGFNRNDVLDMFDSYETNAIDDSYYYSGDVSNYEK